MTKTTKEMNAYIRKVGDYKIKVFPSHYLKKFDSVRTQEQCEERQLQFTLGYYAGFKKAMKMMRLK